MPLRLEIGGIAVGDVEHHKAFHYEAIQTPNIENLKLSGKNLIDHYTNLIIKREEKLNVLFNTTLTTVSIATSTHYLAISKKQRVPFPMTDAKFITINYCSKDFLTCLLLTLTKKITTATTAPKLKNYIILALLLLKYLQSIV